MSTSEQSAAQFPAEGAAQGGAAGTASGEQAQAGTAASEQGRASESRGPVGQGDHVVKKGECMGSIAQDHGFFWETLWNDEHNAELKNVRKDPNVIYPGDRVHIPDKDEKQQPGATEQRHRFRLKGTPAKLRLRFLNEGQPRANEKYTLDVDGKSFSGKTNAQGELTHSIPPDARKGKLLLGEDQEEFNLDLGHVDPVEQVSGLQHRLRNLGFPCGEEEGEGVMGPGTEAALKRFQKSSGLQETGKPDPATREKLVEAHGC